MGDSPVERHALVAFAYATPRPELTPAPRRREWMERAQDKWPNRCLPLLVANESGWTMRNPHTFHVSWSGEERPEAITIEFEGGQPHPAPVRSHFGFGVLTWNVPYVFRTPPGFNLLARGPANWPKDGACALEGVVETDWAFANFTMNWKLTRPGHRVTFEEGEPFCMVVPQRRGELQSFAPEVRDMASDEELRTEFREFAQNRDALQIKKFASAHLPGLGAYKTEWERHYYKGLSPSGKPAPEHQVTLRLPEFDSKLD